MRRARSTALWCALAIALLTPLLLSVTSPLLAWRSPIYIAAGIAGILAMSLLVLQPLLAGRYLPGLTPKTSRRIHQTVGAVLLLAIMIHVAGLWITSPPDVIDALLFRSPTAFSAWGVVAMWALFLTALLAIQRRKLHPNLWRKLHTSLAIIIALGSTVHAMLIDGTMELTSKTILCLCAILATLKTVHDLKIWRKSR